MSQTRSRLLTVLERIIAFSLVVCIGMLADRIVSARVPKHVTLMDRPRDAASSPDFLTRYLDATATEYSIEDGFLSLPVGKDTAHRLRGLLAATGAAIDVIHDDRRKAIARAFTRSESNGGASAPLRRTAEPTSDGRIAIRSHSVSWDQTTWQEVDEQLISLESQYRAVAEALHSLDASTIVPQGFTPVEPVWPGDAKVAAMRPGQDAVTPPPTEEDVFELNRVDHGTMKRNRAATGQTSN